MDELIISELSSELGITTNQVNVVLKMMEEGATIPFIARYRKNETGALDENQIKKIGDLYNYYKNLAERKEAVIRLIDEKGLLTEELKNNILNAKKLVEVEDLYRPYKEKKKTKATDAINAGLEPLAKIIMSFPKIGTLETISEKFINDKVKNTNEAITGASYIIAEWISDNAYFRDYIRKNLFYHGIIKCKKKKNAEDPKQVYSMYYEFEEKVNYIKHYRVLAINRGEKEGILSVDIDYDEEHIISYLESKLVKDKSSFVYDVVISSIKDSLKRLIMPSVIREVRSDLTLDAEEKAINTFSTNLENLLLTKPIKEMRVLGFDPGYINGCKLACIDEVGNYLDGAVIKPFLNNSTKNDIDASKKVVVDLIKKYNIDIISIGNGTASRESEVFCAELIKENNLNCKYVITSEAGASIYSASKLANEELGFLPIEKRSAVSIARRLADPLSELVKIDAKSIGVGEYQYDVNQKELGSALDFITSKVVNEVGVNINTASVSILKYISGLTSSAAEKLYNYKSTNIIKSREEIKKIKGISEKAYEQAIGFLRIKGGDNPLDNTAVHPESYDLTNNLLKSLDLDIKDIQTSEFKEKLKNINVDKTSIELNTDKYTLEDIVKELLTPGLDPRDSLDGPILKSDVLTINDLKLGMELMGTVRNVTSFGAFIDIGLHDDGLAHISKMSKNFVKDPSLIVSVGDIVKCYVDDINLEKEKVNLRLYKD